LQPGAGGRVYQIPVQAVAAHDDGRAGDGRAGGGGAGRAGVGDADVASADAKPK